MATYDDINDTVSARSYLSFELNFMAHAVNAEREDDVQAAIRRLAAAIEQLPQDFHIDVTEAMLEGH